jgi:hypothetical protein
MAAALVYNLAPLKLNTTVLAVEDLSFSPDVMVEPFQHSGNEFPSVMRVSGGNPAIRFKTPFAEAFALIGLKTLKCTVVEVYLAKYVDSIRQTGAVHRKYAQNTSCVGMAYITGANVSQGGMFMADVVVVMLSNDGIAAPLIGSDVASLPTLASEPVPYGMGPVAINGTNYAGCTSMSLDLGTKVDVRRSDGDLYPRVCAFLAGAPSIQIDHADPATMWNAIYPLGLQASSNLVAYLRKYDTTTAVIGTASGMSLTIASGRVVPGDLGARTADVATAPLRFIGMSASTTSPVAVATGVTVPTP